jgi:spore coat polysaccharide biosynthesis protein SpsF
MANDAFQTEQEQFWAGSFGEAYIDRNTAATFLAGNTALFSQILKRTTETASVLELGANIGLNLKAIRTLLPQADLAAVEINRQACEVLRHDFPDTEIAHASILEWEPTERYDLVFSKGVMIHLSPDHLQATYDKMDRAAAKYVLIAEYYNPTPVTIPYRGHNDRLFKRDFAGEFLDRHPHYQLIDYGFVWKRDNHFMQDDVTWFLLQKPAQRAAGAAPQATPASQPLRRTA